MTIDDNEALAFCFLHHHIHTVFAQEAMERRTSLKTRLNLLRKGK